MARVIIASAAEEGRLRLQQLLASSGFTVFRCCASGSELRRAMSECHDGIVVLMGSLQGCTADELQWDYGDSAQVLLLDKPPALERCENDAVFLLPLPTSGQAIVGAVQMLSQLHQMRLPKRGAEEKQVVEEAKRLLMRKEGITEPQAHRALQQYAMRHGMKMAAWAASLLQTSRETEE